MHFYRTTLCTARSHRKSVCAVRLSCHTRTLCPHGSTYDHDFFTIWEPHDSSLLASNFVSIFKRHDPQIQTFKSIQSQIQCTSGVGKNVLFGIKTACISEMVSDTTKVRPLIAIYELSIGTTFDDLECHLNCKFSHVVIPTSDISEITLRPQKLKLLEPSICVLRVLD